MVAEPVAGAFDLDDDAVVQEAVEQRGGDDGIAEYLAPFGESAVGGEDHGALLVAGVDQLEEEVAATGSDGQVADLVDDQQRGAAEEADLLAQPPLAFGFGEDTDDVGQGCEVDGPSSLDRLDAEGGGEMALAGTGGTEQMDRLAAIDEAEFGQGENPLAIERRLVKSKPARVLMGVSRAIVRAILTRRLSRTVSSSASNVSIASSAESSPRSRRPTVSSTISSARGIFRPTSAVLIRSSFSIALPFMSVPPGGRARAMVSYTANGRRATRSPARSRTTSGSSATGRCAERRAGRRWPGATRRRFLPSRTGWTATTVRSSRMRISSARHWTSTTRRRGPIRPAGARLVAMMGGEVDQVAIVDDMPRLAGDDRLHAGGVSRLPSPSRRKPLFSVPLRSRGCADP